MILKVCQNRLNIHGEVEVNISVLDRLKIMGKQLVKIMKSLVTDLF